MKIAAWGSNHDKFLSEWVSFIAVGLISEKRYLEVSRLMMQIEDVNLIIYSVSVDGFGGVGRWVSEKTSELAYEIGRVDGFDKFKNQKICNILGELSDFVKINELRTSMFLPGDFEKIKIPSFGSSGIKI